MLIDVTKRVEGRVQVNTHAANKIRFPEHYHNVICYLTVTLPERQCVN